MELALFNKTGKGKKKAKKKQKKKQKKATQVVHGSLFKSEEYFNHGDSDFLVSKDGFATLR